MLGASLVRRARGGLVAGMRNASVPVPVSAARGRAMSMWSEMPMGPPDPILGLTGERRRLEMCPLWGELKICDVTGTSGDSLPPLELCSAVECCAVQYSAVQCCAVQCSAMLN